MTLTFSKSIGGFWNKISIVIVDGQDQIKTA